MSGVQVFLLLLGVKIGELDTMYINIVIYKKIYNAHIFKHKYTICVRY